MLLNEFIVPFSLFELSVNWIYLGCIAQRRHHIFTATRREGMCAMIYFYGGYNTNLYRVSAYFYLVVQTKSDLQHGGDSTIKRADGHQREATNIQTLSQTRPQVGDLSIHSSSIVAPAWMMFTLFNSSCNFRISPVWSPASRRRVASPAIKVTKQLPNKCHYCLPKSLRKPASFSYRWIDVARMHSLTPSCCLSLLLSKEIRRHLQGDRLNSSRRKVEPKKTSSCSELLNFSQIRYVHHVTNHSAAA